jgi:hypothetical protein
MDLAGAIRELLIPRVTIVVSLRAGQRYATSSGAGGSTPSQRDGTSR